MREFFNDWRRKAGCVALVMACVVAGMWLRSQFYYDGVISWDNEVEDTVYSTNGSLHWSSVTREDLTIRTFRSLPYWSIVLPLTLLSAYLLLWKPRPKPKGKPNA